ncbi:creatininase family protein [Muriicola sp. Z0-33]|uniref:creatininase family protein n=1 Tax=Muriicola sp. Z0-33 TaxID=2816957 RepID=UPI002237C047|nr:creatininase family protein [Muriicola sp. Z0-33]MCW5517722.1 creatininase family protein [Muriicola sp. Z0-33]
MKIRPYILTETNWDALKDAKFELAVLPWGATEAHNYHLPYGTDVYEADYISAAAAEITWEKGGKVIVLPTIPFGVNTGQSDIYLDINLNPSTQLAILTDVIETLNRQGIKKLLIFNSHGGNNFKPLVRELGLKFPEMFLCFSNWFQAMDRSKYFEEQGDHAEEMETSLILHLKPELVLPRDKWGDGASKKFKIGAFSEGWVWAERKWSQISNDTGVGNPKYASKEKGARFFTDITKKMAELFLALCNADVHDLYE